MITIDDKNYDLKFLLNFEMLREILIKLAKNQNNILKDVESIQNSNKERDFKIMKLERMIKELEQENDNMEEFEPKINYIEKEVEIKEKREIESQNNNININEEDKEKSEEKEEEKEEKEEKGEKEEKEEEKEKKEKVIYEKKTEDKKDNIKEDSDKQDIKKNIE